MAFLAPVAAGISSFFGGGAGAVSALATGVGVVSSLAMGSYQAKVAEMNADIAEQNAERAQERARIEAQDNDTRSMGMLRQQEGAQCASGVSLPSGSLVLTRKAARRLGRRDTLNIVYAGDLEAHNFRVDAANQRNAAQGARMQGGVNALGTFLGGVGNLLGTAKTTAVSSKYDPWVTKSTNYRRVG